MQDFVVNLVVVILLLVVFVVLTNMLY